MLPRPPFALPAVDAWRPTGFRRAARLAALLVVIVASVLSTTLLDRPSQIFLLKVSLVVLLSLFPGWLYLHFITVRGVGLYDEYVLNLFRMRIDEVRNLPKPPPGSSYWKRWDAETPKNVDVANNVYLKKFEAVYGRSAVPEIRRHRKDTSRANGASHGDGGGKPTGQRLQSDAFSPVVMAVAFLSVGWTVVIQPEIYTSIAVFGTIDVSGLPKMPVDALRFAFLGAYAFTVQTLVRRYFDLDLKTKAYVSIIARLILVSALVVALFSRPIFGGIGAGTQMTLAFVIGFFPEFGLRLIYQWAAGKLRRFRKDGDSGDPTRERHPLDELDGVNVWMRTRFLEEGIENMQNLATANLIDLMLNTRMPISRLVDWVDQALLYLRVSGAGKDGGDRARLRRIGIRTATDLLDAFESDNRHDRSFHDGLLRVLNMTERGDDGGPSVTEGLRRSLEGEVNLWHIRQWKKHGWLRTEKGNDRPEGSNGAKPKGPDGLGRPARSDQRRKLETASNVPPA